MTDDDDDDAKVYLNLFCRFGKEDVLATNLIKSSAQRGIRKQILEQYPLCTEEMLEILLPKKANMMQSKCRDHISLIVIDGEPLFFQNYDGPLIPTLKVLHKFPDMMPKVQVDKGAIKFILSGADIMCPGLTSKGGQISPELLAGAIVAIQAEGKEHALAIGKLLLSGREM